MIRSWPNDRKSKSAERDESWMKAPIVFHPLSMEDASDELLIIEAVMEGYLVCRMDLVGFAGGVVKPLGKIELEVVFDDEGLFSTVMINFTVVRAPSPYNVIFGRTGLRSLRVDSLTIHSMEVNQNINQEKEVSKRVDLTEHTLVNPSYPDELVTIGGNNLSEQCKNQLRMLLKRSMDVFAWELTDMMRIPRRIIEHPRNINPLVQMAQDDKKNCVLHGQRHVNLEECVDDMVIKSNDEKVMIEDIVETFDNLRRINMKLNPKNSSFRVKEGKFMKYMVTSDGIRANPKKTKATSDMQSPRTLKEMQSLSGKMAALKRFLSRSAGKSLPFFETLKDIMKENKDEYR
nr:reverse transcriptase domain-containing protein [Tanacetum cinerariifolium]